MRILVVTSSYPKYPGDVTAPFIEEISRAVAARGHRLDIVLPFHPELARPREDALAFHPFTYAPHPRWNQWGYAQSLTADVAVRKAMYLLLPLVALSLRHTVARLLQLNRYDLAHIHWLVPNAALLTDLFASSALPTVISLHGSDVFMAEKSWLARGLARRAIRDARAITACSSDLRERVLRLGAEAATTRTVPYGVDTQQFTPGSASPAFRARFGIASDAVLVMAMGRLVEKKGFSYLIEAMRGLAPARLIIVGAGDLRAELEQQARAARIDAVFAGNLARTDVVSALQAADIFVVPSIRDRAGNLDGLPNTLLEALAAGKAIAASRIAGIPEVVRDEENGLLVPEQDSQALRSALARLIADATWRGRLARAARETAVQQLSWEATALRFEECYAQATTLDAR